MGGALGGGAWPLLFAPLTAIAFVFPDGRLPSPRWRPVAIGVAATFVGLLLVSFFEPGAFDAPYQQVEDPLPAAPSGIAWLWPPLLIGAVASLVAAVLAVRVRFLAASGLERLQLKWLAYSAFLVPVTLLVCLAGGLVVEGLEQSDAFIVLLLLMIGGIPASVGIAVLRYRLYDIDRIITARSSMAW